MEAHSLVKSVFTLIMILTISVLLWTVAFGPVGREALWNGVETPLLNQWNYASHNDGRDLTAVYNGIFYSTTDLTTH